MTLKTWIGRPVEQQSSTEIHINMRLMQKYEGARTEIQLLEYDKLMIGIVAIIVAFLVRIFNIALSCKM